MCSGLDVRIARAIIVRFRSYYYYIETTYEPQMRLFQEGLIYMDVLDC